MHNISAQQIKLPYEMHLLKKSKLKILGPHFPKPFKDFQQKFLGLKQHCLLQKVSVIMQEQNYKHKASITTILHIKGYENERYLKRRYPGPIGSKNQLKKSLI